MIITKNIRGRGEQKRYNNNKNAVKQTTVRGILEVGGILFLARKLPPHEDNVVL